ncbi:MAG: two-component sensor histidine kinase [Lachnospiraceae bacterium]|nr:two-component sensor histidine kinase [Lachnospiraceae bacterium]
MKKKINKMLVLIAALAILFTVILITFVYYDLFQKQMVEDLRGYHFIAQSCENQEQLEKMGQRMMLSNVRMTIVSMDGNVIYDNEADQSIMVNHGERPEIVQAFKTGEGHAVRRSETLAKNTFYYASKLDDETVIRMARDAGSVYSILQSAMPSLIGTLLLLVVMSIVIAHFLTKRLIAPIERLASNLDESEDESDYEELTPFVTTIRQQHQDIIKSARMRQEFTANVSHELKTPLTSIMGYAELIENGMAEAEDVTRFASGIRNSAARLLTLINDTIRLSEMDDGNADMVMEQLNLYEMAKYCVEMMEMSASKHKVSMELQGTDCFVTGDRQQLEELLYNLCDNAIRYNNPGGEVVVEVSAAEGASVLVVRDTGIGIPKEHQDRIFERFYRVDKSRSKSTGGTGLGLAIVKHIITGFNAKIEVNSEVGRGTTIKVTFPNK